MSKSIGTRWLLLGIGATVLAGSAGAQTGGIPVTKEGTPTVRSTTSGVAMGEVALHENMAQVHANDLALAGQMNDGQIIHTLIVSDSLEVAAARLGQERLTNAALREYAAMLASDHSAALATELEMNVDEQLNRQGVAGMQGPDHMMRMLAHMRAMNSGAAWDRAWLQQQIDHHRHELEMFNAMEPRARDDDLEQQIERKRPIVQAHLNRALELQASLGTNGNGL